MMIKLRYEWFLVLHREAIMQYTYSIVSKQIKFMSFLIYNIFFNIIQTYTATYDYET